MTFVGNEENQKLVCEAKYAKLRKTNNTFSLICRNSHTLSHTVSPIHFLSHIYTQIYSDTYSHTCINKYVYYMCVKYMKLERGHEQRRCAIRGETAGEEAQ